MAKSKRTATEPRLRLASVKRTYGKAVKDFLRCFFGGSAPERRLLSSADVRRKVGSSGSAAVRRNVEPSGNAVSIGTVAKQFGAAVSRTVVEVPKQVVAVTKRPGDALEEQSASAAVELQATSQLLAMSCSSLLPLPDAIRVLASVFSDITARDIRQDAGRTQNNAGELLPPGVAAMIKALGPLSKHDIYLVVDTGIGNVLAQVALTTCISKCIGVEVRPELCALGAQHIQRHADSFPFLRKVVMKAADVRDVLLSVQSPTCEATIIFTTYFLFKESAKLVVA
ncbi:hypothetical protein PC113_g9942 [Phytophthora cactorum]|uniref:DOT1 domain-containing protein n=1 Tax=Phytophthora cactorum TaxID=29920 RepID=A0A8T0Z749_9STRA|nr:hypothetical protein PC112_g14353 [Phytophthora cactorum]KAG2824616.1 hypothetical protein PC111_g9729 [Phytophthora cactorum]KAG2858278.1 hypothetical protein PC113_g9942 [Phytophthora cactorum]KAG2949619.1 hypothetical protein PC117_g5088 [Phytophthora cactorum]KAG3009703.1 hypothetical protein PC120_g15499 [Phytophthora cactorum]